MNIKILTLGLVALLPLTVSAMDDPVPGKAAVTLQFEKNTYYFGEPCRVNFVLKNTDDKDIVFNTGGDYRGSDRELRYHVEAFAADGQPVPPADQTMCFGGGLTGSKTLKPGEEWSHPLWLLDYLRLTQPGKYKIRVTHDLGWVRREARLTDGTAEIPADWPAPIGEAEIEFAMPDRQQAEKILAALAAELQKKSGGEKSKISSARDLALPVFLEPLKLGAQRGELYFVEAIGEMPDQQATAALLDLAEGDNQQVARAAMFALSERVPFGPKTRPNWQAEKQQRLSAAAWDESFAPRARALAVALLNKFDPAAPEQTADNIKASGYFRGLVGGSPFLDTELAARLLAGIGAEDDKKVLTAALEKSFDIVIRQRERRGPDVNILDLPSPMPDLIWALDGIHEREKNPALTVSNYGALMYFHWQPKESAERPKDWLGRFQNVGAHDRYPLQMAALESVPAPMPPECAATVRALFNAKDYGTLKRACEVAGCSGDKTFLPDVLGIIRAENNEWLFRVARDAAQQLGARRELADALVTRVADAHLGNEAITALQEMVVEDNQWSGNTDLSRNERLAIQAAWKKWIPAHAEDLATGKKFSPGDEQNLQPALFGRHTQWTLPDGKFWPADNQPNP